MSDADKWLAIYKENRALFERAATDPSRLSEAELATVNSALAQLQGLARSLGCTVEIIDPNIAVAAEALRVFDAHYRRKAELDRKLFGGIP